MNQTAAAPAAKTIDKRLLGRVIFLGTEVMFFAGLLSAQIVLRSGSEAWPPPGQPRLPVLVTGLNTGVLLLSGYTIGLALRAIRRDRPRALRGWLLITTVLGVLFLAVQGYEWVRLLGFGLTLSSSVFGGTFYTLIGAHGIHVVVAVVVLLYVLGAAAQGRYSAARHSGVGLCRIYWLFVVAIWPALYVLVYLG